VDERLVCLVAYALGFSSLYLTHTFLFFRIARKEASNPCLVKRKTMIHFLSVNLFASSLQTVKLGEEEGTDGRRR